MPVCTLWLNSKSSGGYKI